MAVGTASPDRWAVGQGAAESALLVTLVTYRASFFASFGFMWALFEIQPQRTRMFDKSRRILRTEVTNLQLT